MRHGKPASLFPDALRQLERGEFLALGCGQGPFGALTRIDLRSLDPLDQARTCDIKVTSDLADVAGLSG